MDYTLVLRYHSNKIDLPDQWEKIMRSAGLPIASLVLLLTACASAPTSREIAAADIGPFPGNYEQIIKDYYAQSLFDPYSAVYTFVRVPMHGFAGNRLEGAEIGWVVCGTLNAKNRFGGFVGAKPFRVVIRYNQIVYQDLGVPWTNEC